MPVVFDFDNGVDGPTFTTVNNTTQSISYTENGVDMTLSSTALDGTGLLRFNGTLPANTGLFLRDDGNDDTFRLDFGGGEISGTAGSPIALNLLPNSIPTIYNGTWQIRFTHSTAGGTQTVTVNNSAAMPSVTGTFTGITFTSTGGGTNEFIGVDTLTVKSATCYLGDVLISTPDGKTQVQDLKPGDTLLTADGGQTTVHWLGRQNMSTWFNLPEVINPIRIEKDAIAPGVPSRDLHISPDHAIEIDGILYNASALVNGVSIYQVPTVAGESFQYFHIETDGHDLLLAEDCPSESYLHATNTYTFENAEERDERMIPEMDLLRVLSSRHVPAQVAEALRAQAVARKVIKVAA